MPITIRSPHNGRPVKVREQDVGRAIRDDEGNIFYVLARSDGQGHYGSRTRQGSPEEEQHYQQIEAQPIAGPAAPVAGGESGEARDDTAGREPDVHDATGPGRPRSELRWRMAAAVLILVAIFVAIVLAWHFWPGEPTPPVPEPVPEHEPGVIPHEDPGAWRDMLDEPWLLTLELQPRPGPTIHLALAA